jgi:dolichyl-phosphate beta-glucosyltransferase
MDLSIIMPAYREGHKVCHDIEAAAAFLLRNSLKGEIIVVDDGSPDDTAEAARSVDVPEGVLLRVIRYETNRGKGYAIRTGMDAGTGRFAMFADVGVCVPYDNALRGLELLKSGQCDMAHGSRKLPSSVHVRSQRLYRRILSWCFRHVIGFFMGVPGRLTDTQCGFKIYRGDVARALYGACFSDGFMFDIEILLRALAKGYRVLEFPVEWRCDWDSRLHPARGAAHTFAELAHIKKALKAEQEGRPHPPPPARPAK